MKHWLPILAALALGVVAGFNVQSFVLPQPSSAYECRFEFEPADTEGFDRQWDNAALELSRSVTAGKRYEVRVAAITEE